MFSGTTASLAGRAGKLTVKMRIPLAGYTNGPATVTLSDTNSPTIAYENVGALPPLGSSGKKWRYKVTGNGLKKVFLKNLAPGMPGQFQAKLRATEWFTAAAANQPAGNTTVTVTIGGLCFTHAVTEKSE